MLSDNQVPLLHYRSDIDGLRAIAVLLVLGFHAGVPFMSGGFIGVDVFFVISGYLITGLLLAEHRRTGTISLWDFWSRRVRRLAPALLLVIAVALTLAPFLLQRVGNETGPFARAALTTLLVNANHFFWAESKDYFAPAAEVNPMLHMWSLSVEEQFYIVWPLLMLLVLRKGMGMTRPSVVVATLLLASFAASLFWTFRSPSTAFFLMPSRAWELAAGALLAIWGQPMSERPTTRSGRRTTLPGLCSLVGIALVIGSGVMLQGVRLFPAPMAVFPVLGAVLFLLAGYAAPANPVTRAAGARWLVYIGKISYPLYLWHWPVLAFMRSHRLYEKSLPLDLLGLGLSFILAALTFEWVERKLTTRSLQIRPGRIIAWGLATTAVLLVAATVLGAWVRFGWGYSEREKMLSQVRADSPKTGCILNAHGAVDRLIADCFPSSSKTSVLLWGDSHAQHWGPAVKAVGDSIDVNTGILTSGGCAPLPGFPGSSCGGLNEKIIESLTSWTKDRHLSGIVLSARWPMAVGAISPALAEHTASAGGEYLGGSVAKTQAALTLLASTLDGVVDRAEKLGIRVLIVLPSPIQRIAGPHCLAVRRAEDCFIGTSEMAAYADPAEAVIRKVAAKRANVRLLDPKDFLCHSGRCPVMLDGAIVYRDEGHITNTIALASAVRFRADMEWLARR